MHFKYSVLAASMAAALSITGCGGGDSDSSTNESSKVVDKGGVVITAMDGYFKNAVLFHDQNNDGKWTKSEELFGKTNAKGELKIRDDFEGTLGVLTVTPGSDLAKSLAKIDDEYAGIYTIDMDNRDQPMSHEVVFRAPTNSPVISPLTELVVLNAIDKSDPTAPLSAEKIAEAEAKVKEQLKTDNLYIDYVEGNNADPALHKTAQILTETQAKDSAAFQSNIDNIVTEAVEVVENTDDKLINDINYKPVVDGDLDTPAVINYKTTLVKAKFDAIQDNLDSLKLKNQDTLEVSFDFSSEKNKLFEDRDLKTSPAVPKLSLSATDIDYLAAKGITATLENNVLRLNSPSILANSNIEFVVHAEDKDSTGTVTANTFAIFELAIKGNEKPAVETQEQSRLQSGVDGWQLIQGEAFNNSINLNGLFRDPEGDQLTYKAAITTPGMTAKVDNNNNLILSGTPTTPSQSERLSIAVRDDKHGDDNDANAWTTISLSLNGVQAFIEPSVHPLENKTWYRLEHGSDDGDGNKSNDYQRIWCDSVLLKDGFVYGNNRSINNLTTCEAEEKNLKREGTYIVQGDTINITLENDPDGENNNEMSIANQADDISTGALIVNDWGERYTFFANKSDAEARLNIQSDAKADLRDFKFELPGKEDGQYHFGSLSMSMTENTGNDGTMDAEIWFGIPGEGITCDTVREFYQSFTLTGQDISAEHHKISSMQLFDNREGGEDYCAVDIDIYQELKAGNTYSLIGYPAENKEQYVEAVKFNIEWTGTGNND